MDTDTPDGLPDIVNYCDHKLSSPSSTTQSSPIYLDLATHDFVPKPYYISPAMKRELSSDGGQEYLQYAPQGQHPFSGPGAMKDYPSAATWAPSIPVASVDGLENYSYHVSSGYDTMSASYTPSHLSPRGWSVASDQSSWNSRVDQAHHQHHQHHQQHNCHQAQLTNGSPLWTDDLPDLSDMTIQLNYQRYQHDFKAHTAKFMSRPQSPTELSCSTPASDIDPSNVFMRMEDSQRIHNGTEFMSLEPPFSVGADSQEKDLSKNTEPYARLIYRAFMSVPSHAMTLQEIYEWFRVNTDKASCPGKDGWKNSIRHNLSMNHAFVRREKPQETAEGDPAPVSPQTTSDAKKLSEWVLEDWAIRDGVQSTTRYRPKGNHHSSKRGRQSPRSHNITYHANNKYPNHSRPGRAVSGEKGGYATGRGKRRTRQGVQMPTSAGTLSQQMSMLNLRMDSSQAQAFYHYPQQQLLDGQPVMYQHDYPHQPSPSSHADTVLATPVTHEGTPAGLGFGPPGPNMVPPISSLQQPTYDVSQYSLGDVAGVYPAGRFFESDDMVYGWSHGDQSQNGSGSPAM